MQPASRFAKLKLPGLPGSRSKPGIGGPVRQLLILLLLRHGVRTETGNMGMIWAAVKGFRKGMKTARAKPMTGRLRARLAPMQVFPSASKNRPKTISRLLISRHSSRWFQSWCRCDHRPGPGAGTITRVAWHPGRLTRKACSSWLNPSCPIEAEIRAEESRRPEAVPGR
jgi:hypothetical protein